MDFTTFTQDYQQITHTIIAEMLHEENLLHEIDTIQISIHATDTYLFASKHENYYYNSANKNTHYFQTYM